MTITDSVRRLRWEVWDVGPDRASRSRPGRDDNRLYLVSGGYRRPAPPPPAHYRPPAPPVTIDVGFFYDSLSPYGDWYFDADFGWVWTPRAVAVGWRPYTEGRWVYTDYGWTWVSSWNWGWAPFHYGRWKFQPRRGWMWVPGHEWAPAWVAWRSGGGWAGWAPLPPSVRFRPGVGLDVGGSRLDSLIDVHGWSFCEERRLVDPRLRAHVVPEPRNVTLVRVTRDVTRYETDRDRVIVRGVDVDDVSRATGRPVTRYAVRAAASSNDSGPARIGAGEVHMYRPEVREAGPGRTPRGHDPREADQVGTGTPAAPREPPTEARTPRTPPARTQPPAEPRTPRTPPARTQPPAEPRTPRPPAARRQLPTRPVAGSDDQDPAKLENLLRREQAALEREHRKELARPPQGVSREELQRRHQQEMDAFRARAKRERALREARAGQKQQKEKDAGQPEKKNGADPKTRGGKKPDRS